jgi:hypothetical protein
VNIQTPLLKTTAFFFTYHQCPLTIYTSNKCSTQLPCDPE